MDRVLFEEQYNNWKETTDINNYYRLRKFDFTQISHDLNVKTDKEARKLDLGQERKRSQFPLDVPNDDPRNDTVPSLIVDALDCLDANRSEGKGKEGRRKRGPKSRAEIPVSPPSPRPLVSLALQMTNRERAAYSGPGDHGKHRLRRAISRLERDFVLLHSNQPGSGSGSGSGRASPQSIARPEISLSLSLFLSPSSLPRPLLPSSVLPRGVVALPED